MTATEALVELDRVVSCLFTSVFVQEGHFNPEKKRPNDINIETVGICRDCLKLDLLPPTTIDF